MVYAFASGCPLLPAWMPTVHRARISLVCKLEHGEYSAVEARNVNFWWPNGQQALKDVNLKVSPGELAMIVGHNGCGKSTLLRILRGLVFPASGNVHIEKPCAFVHQNPNIQIVYPTIGADVALSVPREPDTTARDVRAAVLKALDSVGLHPPEKFLRLSSHRLSGGQRQRVVVAAALAMEPRSILFDEATASMDPMNKMDLTSRVRRLVTNRKIAAIWVTHLLEELDFADTIIIMKKGEVVAQGPRVLMLPLIYEMQDSA